MKKIKTLRHLLLKLVQRKKTQNQRIEKIFKPEDVTRDVWFQIFLRLPFKSVFKSRCVSKVWLSVLSDPNFIYSWYKLNKSSLPWALVGCAIDSTPAYMYYQLKRMFTIMYPFSHSRFVCTHHDTRGGLSFRFLNPSNSRRKLYLLGSSNGLVLSTVELAHIHTYIVCNPLTKRWVSLPPPPTICERVVHGFTCKDVCISETIANYKVVRIPRFEKATNKFAVEIFSSDLGEWNVYEVSCPDDVTWGSSSFNSHLVVHNGVMYWVQNKDRILAYNLKNNTSCGSRCRLIKMPGVAQKESTSSRHCLGVSEGMLRYGTIERGYMTLSVWVLEEEKEEWHLLHKDTISQGMSREIEHLLPPYNRASDLDGYLLQKFFHVLGFNPVDQNVVMLGSGKFIWSYNIITREHEQLRDNSSLYTYQSPQHTSSQEIPLAFILNPRPTKLPPASWVGSSADLGSLSISNESGSSENAMPTLSDVLNGMPTLADILCDRECSIPNEGGPFENAMLTLSHIVHDRRTIET